MTADDLSQFSAEWVEPISTTYRDWTVLRTATKRARPGGARDAQHPRDVPLGQKGYEFGTAKALHLMMEAKKLAYADLKKYIGDPRGQSLPVQKLLSKEWAAQRAKQLGDRANCDVSGGEMKVGNDTTYLTVVDRDGNMVSLIQSNYSSFGSAIVAEGTGFALHNRARAVRLGPEIAECAGGAQAPAAYDHPCVRREG